MSKGLLISLTGFDGAGKSTQVRLLCDYLKKKGYKVQVTEDMFGYFALRPLIGLLRTATGSPVSGPVARNKNPLFKSWFIPAFADIWLGYIMKIRTILSKYDFVIADRFYTDLWANLVYYGYLPNWAFKFFLKLLPKADMPFMLSVNPNIVQMREREFLPEYYEEQAKIYKRLPRYVHFHMINAGNSPEKVSREINKFINERLGV